MSIKTFHNHQSKVLHKNISNNTQSDRCNIVELIEKINLEKKQKEKKMYYFFSALYL